MSDLKADAPFIGEFGDYLRLTIKDDIDQSINQAREHGCVKSGFTGLLAPLQPAMDGLSGLTGQTGTVMTQKLQGTYQGLYATANEYAGIEEKNTVNFKNLHNTKNLTSSSIDGMTGMTGGERSKGHFVDEESVVVQAPDVAATNLSEVMQGEHWGTDAINWIVENFGKFIGLPAGKGLYDILIVPLTGDFNRINANGEAWAHAGAMFWSTSANFSANAKKLTGDHWSSKASSAFGSHVDFAWTPVFLIARESCKWMGKGFEAIANESIKAADKCAELLNRILMKIVTLAAKRLNTAGFTSTLASVGVKWISHGFKLEGKDFPFWGDIVEIKNIVQAVLNLHESITQMVEAIKTYLEGFKQVLNAASQIPDIDSTHKAIDVADEFQSGGNTMRGAHQQFKEAEQNYNQQLKDLDGKMNQSVGENR